MKLHAYDRLVVAYHGTRRETALRIVTGETKFVQSQNDDDWLGHGVYFWEHAPEQAWAWARQRYAKSSTVAVLGALVRLGQCFDLLDPANSRVLGALHKDMLSEYEQRRQTVPKNFKAKKYLDCATMQFAYVALKAQGFVVQTSRGVYVPARGSGRLWKNSWLSQEAHIQLCVRDSSCIMGAWLVPEGTA